MKQGKETRSTVIESSFWLRMQTDYNIQTTKRNKTFAKRLESIRKIAAVL